MPNYMLIAEQMVADEVWTQEGETTDGTSLCSCPQCGCLLPVYLKVKHAHFHAVEQNR